LDGLEECAWQTGLLQEAEQSEGEGGRLATEDATKSTTNSLEDLPRVKRRTIQSDHPGKENSSAVVRHSNHAATVWKEADPGIQILVSSS
jgi:hypothetical protein